MSSMPFQYKRQRTQSAYEESNVDTFVQSCIHFQGNVTVRTAADGVALAQSQDGAPSRTAVLLLGRADALANVASVTAAFPYADSVPSVAAAVESAPQEKVHVVAVTAAGTRVLVGKLPNTASRHNCEMRPDIIHKLVKDAVREVPSGEGGRLDIYVVGGEGYELCVATAVARASNRSFSAKSGRAEQSYLNAGTPVNVVFAAIQTDTAAAVNSAVRNVQLVQRLVNAPTNLLDTTTYTEIAVGLANRLFAEEKLNVTVDVMQGEVLREKGYGGLYGTGKAAEFPPSLVTLTYQPDGGIAPKDKIAFVGKGIVYDTGGLAIKSRDGMGTMKCDMGGSAGVLGAFLTLAQVKSGHTVSCILCMADNAVGPRAQRNDDILRMKSGLTVEVNNTDAEGRLVLSDGVYHASTELSFTPDMIVDMATLTGAQGIATGRYHAAIYANTDGAEQRFVQAGRASGDLCFPVVYAPELHETEFSSTVADMRNSVANRANGQVSCAAEFIRQNLNKSYRGEWVHVDMAGPAFYDQATGYGVALLAKTFEPNAF